MTENVLITLDSLIRSGDDKEEFSLSTTGGFYKKGDNYYIVYKESEATGFAGCTTTIKVWDKGVSITRYGQQTSTLLVEMGALNFCDYPTPAGNLVLDITGVSMEKDLTEKGGNLAFEYNLNSNGMLVSENSIKVNIKEI